MKQDDMPVLDEEKKDDMPAKEPASMPTPTPAPAPTPISAPTSKPEPMVDMQDEVVKTDDKEPSMLVMGADMPPTMPVPSKKNSMLPKILLIVVILAIIGASVTAYFLLRNQTTTTQRPTYKVGLLMAFSGGSSSMGYGTSKGVQLAKKQLSASNIEVIQADSKCEPNEARKAAQNLIDQGVVAIIGDGCSSASVAVLPMANNSKIVMVSPSASSTALSIPNDYFFRVIPSDTYQGEFMAASIRDKGLQNVAIMYTNEPYGANMARVFQEKFENLGGKVVVTAYSEPDVIDLTTQMQKIKDANPQAVFIAPNSVVTATAAINIGHDLGITVPLFGADILYDKTIISNAPEASQGLTVSTFPTGTSTFKQMVRNEYQTDEQLYAAPQAYDAFEAIYRALNDGATNGEQIKSKFATMQFKGMSADISFDQNGEVPGKDYKYDLFKVQDQNFVNAD